MSDLKEKLLKVESDEIGAGLSNNRYRNPEGPQAAARIEELEGLIRDFLREHGGYTIKGELEERARQALRDKPNAE